MNPLLIPNNSKVRTNETHAKHVDFIKNNNNYDTLLIGDSLLENIKDNNEWLNCSVGGDGVEHLLYRMFYINESLVSVLDNFKTIKNIVILIGTNNTQKKNYGKNIYDGIINIVNNIKKINNKIRIIVLGIPPRTKFGSDNKIRTKIVKIITLNTITCNNLLSQNKDDFEYYDISNDFATITNNMYYINKEYYVDDVHFSDLGYSNLIPRIKNIINNNN
ncbi:hypothetical protein Hokovirus_1_249 [Hokovirus HKV1]|uniref:SGNH hydrolase-type esterase domain-containing protein n=1 Tax=Hokovirus HKV1 TaxID=1977638 RepID=A0A1V0SF76_9VIRU|nr:hypothetical protein Hokovirus_1_249 [Hokovirus HKV1]